jgi:hypothetical protein
MTREQWRLGSPARFDVLLSLVVAGLIVVTAVVLLVPQLQFVAVAPGLDLVINTTATLAAAAVAALAWNRYREADEALALHECGAFLGLASINALIVISVLGGFDGRLGMALAAPGQAPLYATGLARLLAAALLIAGGRLGISAASGRRSATVIALGPPVVVVALAVTLPSLEAWLPPLLTPEAILALANAPGTPPLPAATPLGLALQVGIGLLGRLPSSSSTRRSRPAPSLPPR